MDKDKQRVFFYPRLRLCLLILEREKHRCERDTLVSCCLYAPFLGIEPIAYVRALTRNRTHNLLV